MTKRKEKETPQAAISRRISKLLEVLSPVELAAALHVSQATVYRWKTTPPKRPMPLLLEALAKVEKQQRGA